MSVKPFLKWQGGKSKLVENIDKAFGKSSEDYFEPFIGGGAVFFHRQSTGKIKGNAYLSDLNWRLIETYKTVRDFPYELIAELHAMQFIPLTKSNYYSIREEFNSFSRIDCNSKQDRVRLAALFIWLNRACFNGLYRENKAGAFNVPIGSYPEVVLPSRDHIMACSDCLQNAALKHQSVFNVDQEEVISIDVYLDPPYVPLSTTASFTAYNAEGFGWAEQKRLAEMAISFFKNNCTVIISNHGTDLVKSELYPSPPFTHVEEIPMKRTGGAKKTELVATELIVRI